MAADYISAFISAASGLGGVYLGGVLAARKEKQAAVEKFSRDAAYLAVIVASHLDSYGDDCVPVAGDDGTEMGRPASMDGRHQVTTKEPVFLPLDLDVEWKVLPADLLYAIFQLPAQQVQLKRELRAISDFDDDPPEYPHFFRARRRGYAELGLQAYALARRLRMHAGMPQDQPKLGAWSPEGELAQVLATMRETNNTQPTPV